MRFFFLFIFILWGWAETSAFVYVGTKIGGLLTLVSVFITSIIGLSLLKNQGRAVMSRVRTDLSQGRAPVESIVDSIALAVGGILMLIPGYVTDSIGILLFLPGLRTIAGASILHHLMNNNKFKGFAHVDGQPGFNNQTPNSFGNNDDIIEGDVTEHKSQKPRLDDY